MRNHTAKALRTHGRPGEVTSHDVFVGTPSVLAVFFPAQRSPRAPQAPAASDWLNCRSRRGCIERARHRRFKKFCADARPQSPGHLTISPRLSFERAHPSSLLSHLQSINYARLVFPPETAKETSSPPQPWPAHKVVRLTSLHLHFACPWPDRPSRKTSSLL